MIDARQGIGMTSRRTRDRLVQRLRDQGIRSEAVLAQTFPRQRSTLVSSTRSEQRSALQA